jgi:hypothetical protein
VTTSSGASMNAMASDLEAIEKGLRQLGRATTVDALLPGLPVSKVRLALEDSGFRSSTPLETWFGWHNGTAESTIGVLQIFPGFYPLSLEEALHTSKTFRGLPGWISTWLPLLGDGGGFFYVEDQSGPGTSPIRCYRYDQVDHPIEYNSLESMSASIAEGYREGAFFEHPLGYLATKTGIFDAIAARLNPGVAWWDSSGGGEA